MIFVALVVVLVIVAGFLIYGLFQGLATLGRLCKRLFWPDLASEEKVAVAAAAAVAAANCWDAKGCAPATREACPAYNRPGMPCWLANMQADKGYSVKPACLACRFFSLPALLS